MSASSPGPDRLAAADRRLHDEVALTDTHESHTRGVVGWFHRQYLREVRSDLRALGPHRTLDLGCGEGVLLRELGRTAVQLDISMVRLRRARQHATTLVCADAYSIPLGAGTADAVLAIALLEHTRQPQRVLEEAHRVLRPGGAALVLVPNDVVMSAGRLLLAKWPARYPDHLSFITPPRLASWTVGRFAIERSMNLPFGGGFWRNMYHYALLRKV